MRRAGVDPMRLHVTGFPVTPYFRKNEGIVTRPSLAGGAAPRVLYVVNSGTQNAEATARLLLAEEDWEVTCTVGRDDSLRKTLAAVASKRRRKAEILGWTDQIPHLLMTHHVLVSKAGGATTQESIAARCPMVVNQVVPGQEEGNCELLLRHGAGALATTPETVMSTLRSAFSNGGRGWDAAGCRPHDRRLRACPRDWHRPVKRGSFRGNAMRQVFIFNPKSGRSRKTALILPMLQQFISARALDAELVCTEGPGHATEVARDAVAAGCLRMVAIGGDGTVKVAQALIHTPAAMGLVPCGSGNGLALHLGLPKSPSDALELAAGTAGRVAEIDTGTANGLPFVNAMGLGLDADVARRFNGLVRRGLPAYTRTALSAFFSRSTERCHVSVGHQRETIDMMLIAVANSDQYGNNARIAPRARVDDGLLDLVAVRPVSTLSACVLGARLFMGSIDRSRDVRRMKGARFLIERPAAGLIHTDGETHMAGACVEVVVRPRSLRLIVPANCTTVAPSGDRSPAGFALQLP